MKRMFIVCIMLPILGVVYARDIHNEMHLAIEKNDIAKVQSILEQKTNPNQRKDSRASPTFLTQAARLGRAEIVSILLKSGADVDGIDGDMMTPLMHASWKGHLKIVEILLNAGASVNEQSKWGDSALSFAKSKKHDAVVSALLKAGAE